jgi:hypothetical protein
MLDARWALKAALISRPPSLSGLVSLSLSHPGQFLADDILRSMVRSVVRLCEVGEVGGRAKGPVEDEEQQTNTILDALSILSNVALLGGDEGRELVQYCLTDVSSWLEVRMSRVVRWDEEDEDAAPALHKAMLLLLSRAYSYSLKTEDLLELTQGNRCMALATVVGVLEDGETYSTEVVQRQKPGEGRLGQWQQELVCHRFEKEMVLQLCRLLRGFTHPSTYFSELEAADDIGVDEFSDTMDTLLEITLESWIIEKLSNALFDCLFREEEGAPLDEADHEAVLSVNLFVCNLFTYATRSTERFRSHLLSETILVPRLILPYLQRATEQVSYHRSRGTDASTRADSDGRALLQGVTSCLRTLVIASFRAPPNKLSEALLRQLNPSARLLQRASDVARHENVFSLLLLLNINMGALEPRMQESTSNLLLEMSAILEGMSPDVRSRIRRRVELSGMLPVSRDGPMYEEVLSMLHGANSRCLGSLTHEFSESKSDGEQEDMKEDRIAIKEASAKAERARGGSAESKGEGERLLLLGNLPSLSPKKCDREALSELRKERLNVSLGLPPPCSSSPPSSTSNSKKKRHASSTSQAHDSHSHSHSPGPPRPAGGGAAAQHVPGAPSRIPVWNKCPHHEAACAFSLRQCF